MAPFCALRKGQGIVNALFLIGILIGGLAISGCPVASPPKYSIVRLDDRVSAGESLNEHGEVVGQVLIAAGEWRGFVWRPDHTPKLTELPTLGGHYGLAAGINDTTEVAGYASNADGWTHAIHWTEAGGVEDLGALGVGYSAALDVNNLGEAVGHTGYTDSTRRAFIWTDTGGMQVIPGAEADTAAMAISEASAIVGALHDEANIGTPNPPEGRIWYDDGTMDPIPSALGGTGSIAVGLNLTNTVVGYAANGSDEYCAFKWTASGGMHGLGSLGYCITDDFAFCSVASAVNASGTIVGTAAYAGGISHAVLWKSSHIYDLNDCIPSGTEWQYLDGAADISNNGCIVGAGYWMNGVTLQRAAYLLVPALLDKLTLSRSTVHGGSSVSATASLNAAAPCPLDLAINIEGLDGIAGVSSVTATIPEGARSVSFTIETSAVSSRTTGTVAVSFGGNTRTKTLTVVP
ncbi:MAG: hypothetical protein IT364_05475 [Candidatus Hydrogenedentes bacterium]|nr:hypothetical protein [Candidatus Hydrogenedentota bacterium]